jgi:serine/threonine protein phosphatase PrpC
MDKIKSGAFCIPGKSNEDRHVLCESFNSSDFFGFGVFDGHGGTFGSELCSQLLCSSVIDDVKSKVKNILAIYPESPVEGDVFDAIVSESIRKVTKSMSKEIKIKSVTGTTSITLFIKDVGDGSYRIFCANTGDSRCVSYCRNSTGIYTVIQFSEDHTLSLTRELNRIQQHLTLEWYPLPASVHYHQKSGKTARYYPSKERLTRAQELIRSLKKSDTSAILKVLEDMRSDDVSITKYYSEKDSLLSQIPVVETDSDMLDATIHYADVGPSKNGAVTNLDTDSDSEREIEDTDFISAPIVHRASFIGKRTTNDGASVGPIALFSRHNISITMTRSIGDRHAARSCICTPDIMAMTLQKDEYARFVLASDGFWDVVTNDRAVSMISHITDPVEAARFLANKGRALRESSRIRLDDVTCVVIDINPEFNPAHQSKFGGCGCILS